MMSLYEIIQSLREAQGSKAKSAILEANKDNELLQAFLKATYDPAICYFQKSLNIRDIETFSKGTQQFGQQDIDFVLQNIASRKVTGNKAVAVLTGHTSALNDEGRFLMSLLISRSIGGNVGDTMILNAWPDLYFLPPYCRCSLMDDKIKGKFEQLPVMFVQKKLDGSYCSLVKEPGQPPKAITRAGSLYPQWFADALAKDCDDNLVGIGEIEVFASEGSKSVLLDRQTGNGILNSILKGAEEHEYSHLEFRQTCWDMLTPEEFKAGKSERKYEQRLAALWESGLNFVNTDTVTSVADAYKIYSDFTAQGCEGAVLKNPAALWKDGTSKDMVKLKVTFEVDLRVTAMYEGEGKAKGMLGGITVETSDGLLKSNCGTGFSDAMRKEFFDSSIVGKIVTIVANDVISNRDNDMKSLFLPVFSDIRFDKTEADSLERVMAQLEAAKSGN